MTFEPQINSFFHNRLLNPRFIKGAQTSWRIRAKLAVRGSLGNVNIGLFAPGSHQVINNAFYPEHHPALNKALSKLRTEINQHTIQPYEESSLQGDLRYIQLTTSPFTGKTEVVLVANREEAIPKLSSLASDYSLWINLQKKSTNTILGDTWLHVHGEKWLWQKVLHQTIAFHPGSFIQANLFLFEQILQALNDRLLPEKRVLELYAGVGTVGLTLKAARVTMIEINPLAHASFLETSKKLSYPERYIHLCQPASLIDSPEVLILDPPRKGCDPKLLEALANSTTLEQLFYISCSFPSLKSDLEYLEENGWKIVWAEIYDLFPGTDHFEYAVELKKSG